MNIEITEKEQEMILEMCRLAIHNANHIGIMSFTPNHEEYPIICELFNKMNRKK